VELAVATGVPPREWLTDPVAMITASEILQEIRDKR
jgi:hypothetical protein